MSISLGDAGISALTSLLGTDLVAVSRGGVEIARITVANFFKDAALSGTPTSSTPPKANSSTRVATTAYVKTNLADYARLDTANLFQSGQGFGDGTGSTNLSLMGAAGFQRLVIFTSGLGPTDSRAFFGLSSTAESGSDAGSQVQLWTVSDANVPDMVFEVGRGTTHALRISRPVDILGNSLSSAGDQLLTDRQTGWSAPTGTLTRAALDGSGATLAETREALAALITDLMTHGLIGA